MSELHCRHTHLADLSAGTGGHHHKVYAIICQYTGVRTPHMSQSACCQSAGLTVLCLHHMHPKQHQLVLLQQHDTCSTPSLMHKCQLYSLLSSRSRKRLGPRPSYPKIALFVFFLFVVLLSVPPPLGCWCCQHLPAAAVSTAYTDGR